MRKYPIGIYYEGHNPELEAKLNDVIRYSDDGILEALFSRYFDDDDIEGVIEFFEECNHNDKVNNEYEEEMKKKRMEK